MKRKSTGREQGLADILFDQGFGSRRECAGLVLSGRVRVQGSVIDDPDAPLALEGLVLEVQGQTWPVRAAALIMLNKPTGYECSLKPRHHPSVMALLPPPLRQRGLQPVGRLDEDTTGLLLLTDDGTLNHRLTSPKWHVPKIYRVDCRHPLTADALHRLEAGVVLNDDPEPVAALRAWQPAETSLERGMPPALQGHALLLEIDQGKYHQVKRMLAAVSNRVDGLHRTQMGSVCLDPALAPGQWRWLTPDEEAGLRAAPRVDSNAG